MIPFAAEEVLKAKRCFLDRTGVISSRRAVIESRNSALQRSKTYLPGVSEPQAIMLRSSIDQSLDALGELYRARCEDDAHCDRIIELAQSVSAGNHAILAGGRFRIGIAQKALNLYLKYLWCLDNDRPEPPHCTLNAQVLTAAGHSGAWTRLDSITEYREWVSHVRGHATANGFPSAVIWELFTWNGSGPKQRSPLCH